MAITKTATGYRAELYVDNKRVDSHRGFKNRTEAKRWLEKSRVEYERNPVTSKSAKKSDPTFDDLVATYQKLHLPKVEEQTKDRYMVDINLRILPTFKF